MVVTLYHLWVSRKKPSPRHCLLLPVRRRRARCDTAEAPPAVEAVPPEILAVIAAAIAVVLGRPHRVVSVQQAAALAPEGNAWAMEGRVEQFLSHRVR